MLFLRFTSTRLGLLSVLPKDTPTGKKKKKKDAVLRESTLSCNLLSRFKYNIPNNYLGKIVCSLVIMVLAFRPGVLGSNPVWRPVYPICVCSFLSLLRTLFVRSCASDHKSNTKPGRNHVEKIS